MYHYAFRFGIFRFAVKNASVNAKWIRTKCIIFLFGLDQMNQTNQTKSVNTPLSHDPNFPALAEYNLDMISITKI